MPKNIKLIWDFHGIDAGPTAQHHLIHLIEFAKKNNIPLVANGIEHHNQTQSLAYIGVPESYMEIIRDTLKPHRGQWLENPHQE